jgi:Icc-related predicted phosphoesterase
MFIKKSYFCKNMGGQSNINYTDALGRDITIVRRAGTIDNVVISIFRDPYIFKPDAVRLGLLGDLHGHITLGLSILDSWEKMAGLKLDAILQVGDLGVFDEHTEIDAVTREISERDPEELGFEKYHRQSREADRFFGREGVFSNIKLYFIAGNHDDQRVLDSEEPISTYDNIKYVPNGDLIEITKGNTRIVVGALGEGWSQRDMKRLLQQKPDVLLTHEPPASKINSQGNREIGQFIADNEIRCAFFGHIHEGAPQCSLPYKGLYGLNEVRKKRREMSVGSVGFLEISAEESCFLYLPQDQLTQTLD